MFNLKFKIGLVQDFRIVTINVRSTPKSAIYRLFDGKLPLMLPPEVCGCWLCCTLDCASSLLTEFHISNMFNMLGPNGPSQAALNTHPSARLLYRVSSFNCTNINNIKFQDCSCVVQKSLKATSLIPGSL